MNATRSRYVSVPFFWDAVVDRSSPHPAKFLARLLDDVRRYGMPATRRPARLWTAAAAGPSVAPLLSVVARSYPSRTRRPDLDRLLAAVIDMWSGLAEKAQRLPREPVDLSVLALRRSAATTVFLFGREPDPLLVAKLPLSADDRPDREVTALQEAAPTGVAPAYLGRIDGAYLQEGLRGRPYRLERIDELNTAHVTWEGHHAQIAEALLHLARTTAKNERCCETTDDVLDSALTSDLIGEETRRDLRRATEAVGGASRSVLRHGDVSAQNSLFDDGRLAGIVDWESACSNGLPGYDVLNLALSHLEHGIALRRWVPNDVVATFETSWKRSPLWKTARSISQEICSAAGFDVDPRNVEIFFFGRRFGNRLGSGDKAAWMAARMLEAVCAR